MKTTHLAVCTTHSYWCACQTGGTTVNPMCWCCMAHSVPNITSQVPFYFTFHQDCTLLFYIPPILHRVTLHSNKTPCSFTFHRDCTLLLYIPPRLHLVTLHPTKSVPRYFTFHHDCTLLLNIPPRLHLVTLHSTKTAPCYFTFHQDWTFSRTLLFYIPPRLNVFSSSVTKAQFKIPKPVAPESASLIARVHHIVTTGVGNYSNATDCTCVMFTPMSIISQMIQTLKCGRRTDRHTAIWQTYFSFKEEK